MSAFLLSSCAATKACLVKDVLWLVRTTVAIGDATT